jgi:hypothetical protein
MTPNQLRLLCALDDHAGVQIVRPRADRDDYVVLESLDLVEGHALRSGEIRYEITCSGRAAVRTTGV